MTFSVTNLCNSRCKTCFIWNLYRTSPDRKDDELGVNEFEKIFENIGGTVFWATMSGGEPFLRDDLPNICRVLNEYCRPAIINIPSNGLLTSSIESSTKKIAEQCPDAAVIVNLSLDGIGVDHDKIRGVQGNFDKFAETYRRLQNLKMDYKNLQIGIHSVISNFNINNILSIYEYARTLEPDSYITEVAENRTELFNTHVNITPNSVDYLAIITKLSQRVRADYLNTRKNISRVTQAFRLAYYDIASQELSDHRQIIPCYAGYASCQITPYGEVWPCCVLGYDKPMGSLRDNDYDLSRVWFSKEADEVRKYIREKKCACPLANAHYTNMLMDTRTLLKVLMNTL
jgi:MoaA/NifB/PqqE/SkfB family radical SAM enzyme